MSVFVLLWLYSAHCVFAARPETHATVSRHTSEPLQDRDLRLVKDFDCDMRSFAYEYATHLLAGDVRLANVHAALRLEQLCNKAAPHVVGKPKHPSLSALERKLDKALFVDALQGLDANSGSKHQPFQTIARAVKETEIREDSKVVVLREGTHYLTETVVLTAKHSHLTIAAYPGEIVTLSGGHLLTDLNWAPYKGDIVVANLPEHFHGDFNTLYVDGERAVRARYPNCNTETCGHHTLPTGYVDAALEWLPPKKVFLEPAYEIQLDTPFRADHAFPVYKMGLGGGASHFDPPRSYWACNKTDGGAVHPLFVPSGLKFEPSNFSDKVQDWSDPTTGYVFAFQGAYWGSWWFEIEEVDKQQSEIHFGRGGFQEARGWATGGEWYVDNILEELDTPGEWFLDPHTRQLYYYPNNTQQLESSQFVAGMLATILTLQGTPRDPVVGVELLGLTFAHTRATFMERYEVPSGGDWSIHRGGAVFLEYTQDVLVDNCQFWRLGGNGLFLSDWNRRTKITNNEFAWIGDSAIALLGSTRYADATDSNFPKGTLIEGNIIHEIGLYTKQVSAVFQSLAMETTIRGNILFNGPRAGINLNDGLGGGNVIEGNLLFNWCRETFDHGPINSWDRLPYVYNAAEEGQPPEYTTTPRMSLITRNFLINSYHGTWPSDHDDGSCHYHDIANFCVYGGWKNFLGHSNVAALNIYALADIGWEDKHDLPTRKVPAAGFNSPFCLHHPAAHAGTIGYGNTYVNNTCFLWASSSLYDLGWDCDPTKDMHGLEPTTANNVLFTPHEPTVTCKDKVWTWQEWLALGFDHGSKWHHVSDIGGKDIVEMGRKLLMTRGARA